MVISWKLILSMLILVQRSLLTTNHPLHTTQGYAGGEVLVYTVTDGNGGVASALVTININGNRAPGAVDDAAQTDDVTSIEIAVLANDLDVDGDALNLQSAEAGFGSVTIMDNGSLNVRTPYSTRRRQALMDWTLSLMWWLIHRVLPQVLLYRWWWMEIRLQKQRMTASIPVLKQPLRWMCWPMTWISMAMS